MIVGSPRGMLIIDPEFSASMNEWVEYYPQLEVQTNQTYSPEFNHTYLNFTLYDSKGNTVNSRPVIWSVDSRSSMPGWVGAIINHADNYSPEVQNLGPDWFYAKIGIYVSGQHFQKPLFYYGIAGLIMASSYLVLFLAGWGWTKRRGCVGAFLRW